MASGSGGGGGGASNTGNGNTSAASKTTGSGGQPSSSGYTPVTYTGAAARATAMGLSGLVGAAGLAIALV